MENKMMVMRKALRDVARVAEEMTRGTIKGESVDRKTVDAWAMRLCEIISRDLAIPPRNCDVGTAEEQWKRFDQFCIDWEESGPDGGCSDGCPCMAIKSKESDGCFGQSGCFSIWAQMPYNESEAIQ